MTNVIRHKYSNTSGTTPTLVDGEIALNQSDETVFYRNGSGTVKKFQFGRFNTAFVPDAFGNVTMAGSMSGGTTITLSSALTAGSATINSGRTASIGANIWAGAGSGVALDLLPDLTTGVSAIRFLDATYSSVFATLYAVSGYAVSACSIRPEADNTRALGAASFRYATVYSGGGVVTTSDEREKTVVMPLTDAEIAAASAIAKEVGTFQFLTSVAEKADAARCHVGMTVQRAADIMAQHGLDPWRYGFMCHDEWEAAEAVPGLPAVDGSKNPAVAEVPSRLAGDRYSFRTDQLALFMVRGLEARLTAIECRLSA